MPNTKSAKKDLKKNKKNAVANLKVKSTMKNLTKVSVKAIASKAADKDELLKKTIKAIDKAAKKGVIKKNTASRKKSKLQKKANTVKK
jgi:small subunit ribosomal protein S20